MDNTKEYTPLRRVYAMVGFITIAYLLIKGAVMIVHAQQFIAASGY